MVHAVALSRIARFFVHIDPRPHWGTAFRKGYQLLRRSRPRRHLRSVYVVCTSIGIHTGEAAMRRSRPRAGFYMPSGVAS